MVFEVIIVYACKTSQHFKSIGYNHFILRGPLQRNLFGAVVVAQLVERLLPIPEVRGLNPVIGNN